LGAAEEIRESKGLFSGAAFSFHQGVLERVQAGSEAASFEAARLAGRDAELADVVELALA
jgi:hypothetical protein